VPDAMSLEEMVLVRRMHPGSSGWDGGGPIEGRALFPAEIGATLALHDWDV